MKMKYAAMEIVDLEQISVQSTKSVRAGKEMKERMDNQTAINVLEKYTDITLSKSVIEAHNIAIQAIKDLEALLEAGKWILCSKKMPPVETEVFIVARRKYKGGEVRYITTTAMYEDGTVLENDSCWRWEEIEGEWDEENDCYIIPEGWWENRHYNPDEVYNNMVDDEVVAWLPLPKKFEESEE